MGGSGGEGSHPGATRLTFAETSVPRPPIPWRAGALARRLHTGRMAPRSACTYLGGRKINPPGAIQKRVRMNEFKSSRGRAGGRGSSGERGTSGRRVFREESPDALLDIADDLEDQARDLLRRAKQLQRIAERMTRTDGAPSRATRGERGDRGERARRGGPRERDGDDGGEGSGRPGRGEWKGRGGSREGERRPRGAPAHDDHGEDRGERFPEDEWRSVSDRRPKRSPRQPSGETGTRERGRGAGGGRGSGGARGSSGAGRSGGSGGSRKPEWAPKGKRPGTK